jgi:hypothetical protein
MLRLLAFVAFLIQSFTLSFASPGPQGVPRLPTKEFVSAGLFEGGKPVDASLQDLRVAEHREEGFERWVIDFADASGKKLNSVAPRFQIQYIPSEKTTLSTGGIFQRKPAKFIFFFRSIARNHLSFTKAAELASHSLYVSRIHVYPPIEQGDMAMEFVLRDDVLFEPYQPVEKEGRLVLDLKAKP